MPFWVSARIVILNLGLLCLSTGIYNPQDLQKINLDKFEKVYLVIPDDSIPFYYESVIGNRLKKISNFKIKNTLLEKEEK